MTEYIATFHTHLSALKTHRALTASGMTARMAPVPRRLSSSCGTCVMYTAQDFCLMLLDADVEHVYQIDASGDVLLLENE